MPTTHNICEDILSKGHLDDYDINEIIQILIEYDDIYENDGQSPLSDKDYDVIRSLVRSYAPTHEYFIGIGSNVRGGKVDLPYEMGSLDQVEVGGIQEWITDNSLNSEKLVVTDKLDGISAMLIYDENGKFQIAYSRGNGVQGADISRHIKKFKSVPQSLNLKHPIVIRGEVILRESDFAKIKKDIKPRTGEEYKNARNATSGIMNSKVSKADIFDYMKFVSYEVVGNFDLDKSQMLNYLEMLGFEIPKHKVIEAKSTTDEALTDLLNEHRTTSVYAIDGIVIDVNSIQKRLKMNPTRDTLNPAYSIKYKVADASNMAHVKVVEVEWNISKHGYLKPRVEIEPVELVGVTITHATGFNAKFIYENGIGPGAVIQITRSGDVIPFIQKTIKSVFPQMPIQKWDWNETKVDAVLQDAHEEVVIQQIIDFFSSLDVAHLKEGNIRKMYEHGLNTIDAFVLATRQEYINIIGENGKKIYDDLSAKLSNIEPYKLFGATPYFGRGVGVCKFKKLFEKIDLDTFWTVTEATIVKVDGFEEKTANKIIDGIPKLKAFLENVKGHVNLNTETKKVGSAFADQKVVFTGFRNKDFSDQVELQGGTMQSSVSSKTTLLVCTTPNSNSGKIKKARDLGITVISVEQLQSML